MKIHRLILPCLLAFAIGASAQMTVDPDITAEDAVQNYLLGLGIVATNVTYSGDEGQVGVFESNGSNMPITDGVILGTGQVIFASGTDDVNVPGTGGNMFGTGSLNEDNDFLGNDGATDPDLEILSGLDMNDAAIIEFDFVAEGDSMKFNYVFASEEYPGFVCSGFNDVFGFFLSGPGIDGGGQFENNAVNIATIPNSDPPVPIAINTVNSGTPGAIDSTQCQNANPNWQEDIIYYIDNPFPNNDANSIEYNGFTVNLEASSSLICGETYHIKIAIADAGDTGYDSAVFLESGSFGSNAIAVSSTSAIAGNLIFAGDSVVVEGCNEAQFSFSRPNTTEADTIRFEILGTAENGVDYTQLADSLIFLEGESTIYLPFSAVDDGITEGFEDISIRYIYTNGCGEQDTALTTLYVADYINPTVTIPDTPLPCPGDAYEIVPDVTGFGGFTYEWGDGSTDPTLTVNPTETTTYSISVTDVCGTTVTDQGTISLVEWDDLTATPIPGLITCPGDETQIGVEVTGGSPGYTFLWTGLTQTTDMVTVGPLTTTTYDVTVSDQCSSVQTQVIAEVLQFSNITTLYTDTVCSGSSHEFIDLQGGTGNYNFNVFDIIGDPAPEAVTVVHNEITTYTGVSEGLYQVVISDDCPSIFPFIADIYIENCDTYFPNVFSPDSDGDRLNETFQIIGLEGFNGSSIKIYNRWGTLVYEDNNYRNTRAWDGRDLSGNELSAGVYFYTFVRSDGKEQHGSVTILRKD